MNNKGKILFYDIDSIYRLQVNPDGTTIVYSSHKRSKGKPLSQWYNPDGYLVTKLHSRTKTVHSIVATCFLGDRPEWLVINHIDGDKLNNHPTNLEYCTVAHNIRHAIQYGLHVLTNGKGMPTYKDGRCADIKAYKKQWYLANKDRLKKEKKMGWNYD